MHSMRGKYRDTVTDYRSLFLDEGFVRVTMSRVHRRILSLPRSYARQYTTNNTLLESPSPQTVTPPRRNPPRTATHQQARHEARVRSRRSPPHVPTQPQTRHEAHEGTAALNVPFNPPGGGPGANIPGGGGGLTFTRSPFLDAMLTTAIGLGAGKSIAQHT